tara:strand:- start:10149 stop:12014 length:1866 start_codon:yes stop_codon:yes gene_type:complete
MNMTGKNGINNKLEYPIILFDSSVSIEQIKKLKDSDTIISFDYTSTKLLEKQKIKSIPSEDVLSIQELKEIQTSAYLLSDWYTKNELTEILSHKNVNLGSLIQSELINILVNFLKNFYCVYKIVQKFNGKTFLCSKKISEIIKQFTSNFSLLKSQSTINQLPLDSLNTNVELSFKSINLKLKIDTKNLKKIKSLTESVSKSIIHTDIKPNSKFFLFSEINTKKFLPLFKKMQSFPDNYIVYNRRQPSIWDKESFSIFKKSHAILENEKTLKLNKKNIESETNNKINEIINNLKNHDELFKNFFTLNNISFWKGFRGLFFSLLEKRFLDYSYEIELSDNLINKYNFSGILLQNEVGPNEQILLQLGKSKNLPVFLLQHGLIFDTADAFMMNKYQGVLGNHSDYQLVWGDVDFNYRKNMGLPKNRIIKIGSPIYENISTEKSKKHEYILLATSGPTTEDVFDLSSEVISKNIHTIESIAKTVLSLNQKLVVKIHPSPDEFDPTKLLQNIDTNIEVIKTGNITNLIKNCSMMIVIDFSSVILDAHLQNKPVISINVKENGYGVPTAFSNGSCSLASIENLKEKISSILTNNSELISNGSNSAKQYIHEPGNSSNALLNFLSKID